MVRPAHPPFPGPIPPIVTPDGLVDDTTYRLADGSFPDRDGTNPVERMALHRISADVAALTASEIVQIALWPTRITELAKLRERSSAILYNTLSLANRRRYEPVRKIFVEYLRTVAIARGFPEVAATIDGAALAHLIEAERVALRDPRPLPAPGRRDQPLPLPAARPFDPADRRRAGHNPIERLALTLLREHLPAQPASIVVQHALGPLYLAEWAARNGTTEGVVYNMLGHRNQFAHPALRRALAQFLGVSVFALDWLIEARRTPEPFKVGLSLAPSASTMTAARSRQTPALAAVQETFDLE